MNGTDRPRPKSAPPIGEPTSDAPKNRASFCAIAVVICSAGTTFRSAARSPTKKKTKSVPSTAPAIRIWTNVSRSSQSATATLASASARPASAAIITRLRSQRSTSAPAGSVNKSQGTVTQKPVSPAFAGECVGASTSSGYAT